MLSLALAALLTTPGEFVLPWGTLPAALSAADHVAVVIVDPGHGPEPRERRREIMRSGTWMREVQGTTVSHHDFGSGISVQHWRDEASGNQGFSINRHPADDRHHLYSRVRTGERDHVLGEDCFVWRSARIEAPPEQNPHYLSCETADGIQLWSRSVSGLNGWVIGSSRTLLFTRRPVSGAGVRPPPALLRWRSGRDFAPEAGRAVPSRRPANYEVRLEGRGTERARILRAGRGWTYEEGHGGYGRTISIRNNLVTIEYRQEPDGRPLVLVVRRLTADERQFVEPPLPEEPLAPPTDRILGELCSWAAPRAAAGIVVTSGTHRRCLTRDGLPLRIYSHHRWLLADLTATRIVRRRLPISALEPPRGAFSWAAWGVTFTN